MTKILYVSYLFWPGDFGGELLITRERLENLVERGLSVTVLTSRGSTQPTSTSETNMQVLSPRVIPFLPRKLAFIFWVLLKLISDQYDAVHLGVMPFLPILGSRSVYVVGWIFARVSRVKGARVITVHSLANEYKIFDTRLWIKRKFLDEITHIVSVSTSLHNAVAQEYGSKAVLILNSVDARKIEAPEENVKNLIRAELGIKENEVVFSFLGSISYRKGFDLLADAFASLSCQYPNWKLLVIGPRNQTENQNFASNSFDGIVHKVSQNDKVFFLGRVDDRARLAGYLSVSDVFVFPTRREGMPLAPLEAMLLRLPVIVTRIPGVTDIACKHDKTGILLDKNDSTELAEAMKRLGENADLRRKMGLEARQHILDELSWDTHIDAWRQLYTTGKLQPVEVRQSSLS